MADQGYTRVLALVITSVMAFALFAGLTAFAQGSTDSAKAKAPADPTAEAVHYVQVRDYTNAVTLNQTIAWNSAAWGDGLLALARDYVPPPPPVVVAAAPKSAPKSMAAPAPRVAAPSGGSTGTCGGSKYDYVIPKESGGNPNAHNPSGATGCYQIMPATWSGSCSDLGAQQGASTQAQAACADRLSPGAWAASQGK